MKTSIRKIGSLVMMVGILSIFSCKENSEKSENAEGMENEIQRSATNDPNPSLHQEEVKTTGMAAFNDEITAKAYQSYIALKDALVQTNSQNAATAAADLKTNVSSEMGNIAQQISDSKDINAQRELFSQLTAKMEPMLEDKISSGEIYKQYCPMAFEGKGDYWFSDSKQIRNPYFGDKMLTCGRVDKTIN